MALGRIDGSFRCPDPPRAETSSAGGKAAQSAGLQIKVAFLAARWHKRGQSFLKIIVALRADTWHILGVSKRVANPNAYETNAALMKGHPVDGRNKS